MATVKEPDKELYSMKRCVEKHVGRGTRHHCHFLLEVNPNINTIIGTLG